MKYGRNQINKAGEIIMSAKDNDEYNKALEKINEWRTLHLIALDRCIAKGNRIIVREL